APAPAPAGDRSPLPLLQVFWSQALGCDTSAVSASTDLFAAGGDSMDAVYLQTRIEECFGIVLPDHAVFEAPTPGEMVELIAENAGRRITGRKVDGRLIRFAGGDPGVAPLFMAIPGGVPAAGWLARHLDAPRGIALINARRFQGSGLDEYDAWLDTNAADGVRHILAIDPRGPWRLMVVCGQSMYFWEVARRLSHLGSVSLFMFDPYFGLPEIGSADDDPLPAAPDPADPDAVPRGLLAADFDLTLLITQPWSHRPVAERFAAFSSGPVDLRLLPASVGGHGIHAAAISLVAAELRIWLASRDLATAAG
ncbi:MAG: acyl carrier protein, partial [Chloroflexota bacterium]